MNSSKKRFGELQEYFKTHNKIKELRPHQQKVHSVRFNCDGKKLGKFGRN